MRARPRRGNDKPGTVEKEEAKNTERGEKIERDPNRMVWGEALR